MNVWILDITDEGCNDYAPRVFAKKPSEKRLRMLAEEYSDEPIGVANGCGVYGTHLYFNLKKVEVE